MKFLSQEQKEFYKENGYVKLGNVLSPDESDRISNEYSDLFLVSFIEKLTCLMGFFCKTTNLCLVLL